MTTPAEDPIPALHRKAQEARKNRIHPFLFGTPPLTELATGEQPAAEDDNGRL